jgi:cytolysin (calcineurin-like family phosphatase)
LVNAQRRDFVKRLVKGAVVALVTVTSLAMVAPLAAYAKNLSFSGLTAPAQYQTALKAYDQALATIDQTFFTAIASAIAAEAASLKVAKTSAEKLIVRSNFLEAKAVAIANRQAALIALGDPPNPPVTFRPIPTP